MIGGPRQGRNHEHRLPAAMAVLVGVALYAGLPSNLTFGTRFAVPTLEGLLLVPLVAVNPRRFTRETAWSRALSLLLVAVVGAANLVSLVLLVHALVSGEADDAKKLLLAALQVWLTNIIVFGLAYWEMDRGGPVKRAQTSRGDLPLPTSGSLRTRTVTPSTRSPGPPQRKPTGRQHWWTTCTSRSQTRQRSARRTRCPCPPGRSC